MFRDIDLDRIQSVETGVKEEGSFISELFWFGKRETVYIVRFRTGDGKTLEVLTENDIRSDLSEIVRENLEELEVNSLTS